MKKTILYSLFIVGSINFSLHSQETNIQDNDDLLLIFDDNSEEIHPLELENVDTISFAPQIQSYVHDLEFDPISRMEIVIEDEDKSLPEEIFEPSLDVIQIPENMQTQIIDSAVLPVAPEDIKILDYYNTNEQDSLDNPVLIDMNDLENINPIMLPEQCEVSAIEQNQLEELLNMQCQQMEQYLSDVMTASSPQAGDCQTIPVDDQDVYIALNNGINLINDTELTACEDDDIVPVPHDLINSVKKATKQKKKLEKKEKSQLKKSKIKNRKSTTKKKKN